MYQCHADRAPYCTPYVSNNGKVLMGRAYSPLCSVILISWGVAPGWYGTRLIANLQPFCCRYIISSIEAFLGKQEIRGTHRPVTNKTRPPFDGLPKTFERDDALWSDNEYSDVVLFQDLTIRVSQDQSQRARLKKRKAKIWSMKMSNTLLGLA
jgi:hypothetical protein